MVPMPPAADSLYLPPLDKALVDGHLLISWKTAYEALCDPDTAARSSNLERFLTDDLVIEQLLHEYEPFQPSSQQTKSDFGARTNSISVSTPIVGSPDVAQVKEDAAWLSTEGKIDEVQALRIVILEWQSRSAGKILNDYTEEENISLQKAVTQKDFSTSTFSHRPLDASTREDASTSSQNRRTRFLQLLVSERLYALRAGTLVAAIALGKPLEPEGRSYGTTDAAETDGSPADLLSRVHEKLNDRRTHGTTHASDFIGRAVSALQARFSRIVSGSGSSSVTAETPEVEEGFMRGTIAEVVSILELLFIRVSSHDGLFHAKALLSWFTFMDNYGFFEQFQVPFTDSGGLGVRAQTLVSLISLQLLKLPYTLDYLEPPFRPTYNKLGVIDREVQTVIYKALWNAASNGSTVAGPAALAWALIVQAITRLTHSTLQIQDETIIPSEDDAQTQDSLYPQLARRMSHIPNELTAVLDNMKQITDSLDASGDATQALAKAALDDCSLLNVVGELSRYVPQLFGPTYATSPRAHAQLCLLELLRQIFVITNYRAEIVQTSLAILNEAPELAVHAEQQNRIVKRQVLDAFISDDVILQPGVLQESQRRYPIEMTPFLQLSRSLIVPQQGSDFLAQPLSETTTTFTCMLPAGYNGYEIVREDEESNCIRLTEDLPLFANRRSAGRFMSAQVAQAQALVLSGQDTAELSIPRGTIGYVLSDSRPLLVMWRHHHSTLKYLGLLLSTVLPNSSKKSVMDNGVVDKDIQAEIIQLVTALMTASVNPVGSPTGENLYQAHAILAEASDDLDRNEDIITVVADIFENEISAQGSHHEDSDAGLLSSCIKFLGAVASIEPSRVWPLLSRSTFLGLDGSGSRMVPLIASSQSALNQQTLLYSCINLLQALVADVVDHAALRKSVPSAQSNRYEDLKENGAGTSQKLISKVLVTYIQQTITLLHWFCSLTPESQVANAEAISTLLEIYDDTVHAVFGLNGNQMPEIAITAALVPAAELILVTMSDTGTSSILNSLLTMFLGSDQSRYALESTVTNNTGHKYLRTFTTFVTHILEVLSFRDTPFSPLEGRLSSALPFFVRLYAADITARPQLLILLRNMIRRSSYSNSPSSSLLGHLASETGKTFLTLLQDLGQPLGDAGMAETTWDFLSAIASSKQQSLMTLLTTGDTPKQSLTRRDEDTAGKPKAFATIAIDMLKEGPLATRTGISMLRFICLLQQSWPSLSTSIRKETGFLNKAANFLGDLNVDVNRPGPDKTLQLQAAHIIVDIFSIYIHNMRHLDEVEGLTLLRTKLTYLRAQGVAIPAYNISLHSNLKRNFEKRFPGCALSSFRLARTPMDLGNLPYYDMNFANRVMSFDPSWDRSGSGFAEEFRRANENMSLVETQIMLMGSWKYLAIELSMCMNDDNSLQQSLAGTVEQCLLANAQSSSSEEVFDGLAESRAELAQLLLQRLTSIKHHSPTMLGMLHATWDVIKGRGQDFETAFVGDNQQYLRMLLGILVLALQPHTYSSGQDPNASQSDNSASTSTRQGKSPRRNRRHDDIFPLLITITGEVISKGFLSLASQAHENPSAILPSDFGLIISILQSILHINDISTIHAQLTLRLCDSNVHRYGFALFSWSDRLLGPDTDPVIGELSISFLRELTSIPQMAEYLATEGILSQLDTAPLLNFIRERPSGYGPLDTPARLHAIWAKGVLPLTLNVLIAIGESFAAEATLFLNGFTNQLSRVARVFGPQARTKGTGMGAVTLDEATEVHTLSLIALALDRYRTSPTALAVAGGDIPELAWEYAVLKEDLESWVGRTGPARGRVVAVSDREARFARMKAQVPDAAAGSRLEEMVVEQLTGALFCLGTMGGGRE